jgi:hypothetical protein
MRKDPHPVWQFWKSNDLHKACEVSEAYSLISSTSPEIAIPQLASLLLNAEESILGELDVLFMGLADRLPISQWPVADEKTRSQSYHYPDNPRLRDERTLSRYPSLLIIAFCHPSGRVRQEAVRNSGLLPPKFAMPLLLIRVNDWVEEVRNAAAAELTPPLKALDPAEKMALVPVMFRLRECGRHQKAAVVETWLQILATPFDEQAWLTAWRVSRDRDKKGYLEILKTWRPSPSPILRKALLHTNHRLALFWLIREVLPTLHCDERDEVFSILQKSRVAAVRREWMEHCVEFRPRHEVESLMKEALLAQSRITREFARFHLSQSTSMDFATFYREALTRPKDEATALEALAEVAPEEGHQEALKRLDSKTPAVLKAAIKSLPESALGNHLDFLLEMMGSELPGAPKAARQRLFQIRRLVGVELTMHPERWDDFPVATQLHLIRLAPEFQKWDGLEFLLKHLQGDVFREELMAALTICHLKMARSFSKLQPARKEKLLTYVRSAGLTIHNAESLRFLIAHSE